MPRFSEILLFLQNAKLNHSSLQMMANWDFFLNLKAENNYEILLALVEHQINEVEARQYLHERMILPFLELWPTILCDTQRYNDGYFLRHFCLERDVF